MKDLYVPDERLIYLALKNVFRGADSQLRKSKKIRDLVLKHQNDIDVRNLIEAHNIDTVCNVAKTLLEQQIFESTLKAKIRFPEVFEVSPAQSAERSASEQEAARSEADVIQTVAESSSRAVPSLEDSGYTPNKITAQAIVTRRSTASLDAKKGQNTTSGVPSLYPVYLSYQTQHRLLVTVQQVLERACYGFAVRNIPELVERERWECAESVELSIWARILTTKQEKFLQEDLTELSKPLKELFDSIAQLRHTAVHRLRISANRLEAFLSDAESLSRLLHDHDCSQQLSRLRRETHLAIEDIKRNKDLLESQLAIKLKKIAAQRAELDRLERSVIAEMLREDQEYQHFAGNALDQAVDSPSTVVHSVAATEQDNDSDVDVVGVGSHDLDSGSS